MTTMIGTSHFINEDTAVRYYRNQGFTRADVRRKHNAGEIHYGPPKLAPGEYLELVDCFTRYAIVSTNQKGNLK